MRKNEHNLGGGLAELPQHAYPEPKKLPPARAGALNIQSDTRNTARRCRASSYPQSVTTAGVLALQANPKRVYLFIQNLGTANVHVNYGNPASIIMSRIGGNGASYEPGVAPTDAIYLTSASGTQSVIVVEGVEVERILE